MRPEYRIHITLTNGKSYAASRDKARVVFKPFLKQITKATLQTRYGEGPWSKGPLVEHRDGSFEVLFGSAA